MNSKEREGVLDLYKHISAGLMKRKGNRLMLSKVPKATNNVMSAIT